jgi:hypothetical protein
MKSWTNNNCNRLKKIIDRLSAENGRYICRLIHRDLFKDIYPILIIIYVFILGGFLLWPFDFIFLVKNDARWIGNLKGVEFLGKGQAMSNFSTQELFDRLVKVNGLTLEVVDIVFYLKI